MAISIAEVTPSVAAEYGWPDRQQVVKPVVAVDPERAAALVGTYRLRAASTNHLLATVTLEHGKLFLAATGAIDKTECFFASPTRRSSRTQEFPVTFSRSGTGGGTTMTVYGDWSGPQIKQKRSSSRDPSPLYATPSLIMNCTRSTAVISRLTSPGTLP